MRLSWRWSEGPVFALVFVVYFCFVSGWDVIRSPCVCVSWVACWHGYCVVISFALAHLQRGQMSHSEWHHTRIYTTLSGSTGVSVFLEHLCQCWILQHCGKDSGQPRELLEAIYPDNKRVQNSRINANKHKHSFAILPKCNHVITYLITQCICIWFTFCIVRFKSALVFTTNFKS